MEALFGDGRKPETKKPDLFFGLSMCETVHREISETEVEKKTDE